MLPLDILFGSWFISLPLVTEMIKVHQH